MYRKATGATRQFSDADTAPILITLRDHLPWHLGKGFIEVQSISVARRSFRSEARRPAFEPARRQRMARVDDRLYI